MQFCREDTVIGNALVNEIDAPGAVITLVIIILFMCFTYAYIIGSFMVLHYEVSCSDESFEIRKTIHNCCFNL